jgi:hypothetical protein
MPTTTKFIMMAMTMMMIYITAGWQLDVHKSFHKTIVHNEYIFFIKNFLVKKAGSERSLNTFYGEDRVYCMQYAKHVDILNPSMKYIMFDFDS